ncbi:hypothetical protein K7H22_19055 [Seohaeicola saemankumensis]|uniref:hypothetical protein n=1 Tax=Seohaeicola saemankumensis TaxID=481181 RepID=UPI001E31BF2D|nr:hypothetical protein [Seohaeicola saemankumensis]MCD1628096.1 hypothetical protein [Seohaeicola saemankumensis]
MGGDTTSTMIASIAGIGMFVGGVASGRNIKLEPLSALFGAAVSVVALTTVETLRISEHEIQSTLMQPTHLTFAETTTNKIGASVAATNYPSP